jgi:hypothetical protein
MTYWLEMSREVSDGFIAYARRVSVQGDIDHILRPREVDDEVANSGHGCYEPVLNRCDNQGVQQALRLDEDCVVFVV